jgi:hypothetical protein
MSVLLNDFDTLNVITNVFASLSLTMLILSWKTVSGKCGLSTFVVSWANAPADINPKIAIAINFFILFNCYCWYKDMRKKVYNQIFLKKSFISIKIRRNAITKKKHPNKAIPI